MWDQTEHALERTFEFANFMEALSFVNDVGEIAESLGHHPDICIKNYKQVFISTTTHDEGSEVTEKDHELTREIDELYD